MIVDTITNSYQFERAFKESDTYKNHFTKSALDALFEYLTDLSEDIGESIELDVVAIACEWIEYDSALEAAQEYGYGELEDEKIEDEEEQEKDALKWLEQRTTVVPFDGTVRLSDGTVLGHAGVLVQQF